MFSVLFIMVLIGTKIEGLYSSPNFGRRTHDGLGTSWTEVHVQGGRGSSSVVRVNVSIVRVHVVTVLPLLISCSRNKFSIVFLVNRLCISGSFTTFIGDCFKCLPP